MDFFRQALELLAGYTVRWRTRGGFVRIALVIALAAVTSGRYFSATPQTILVLTSLLLVIWIVVWIVGSGRIAIPRSNLTVVFAIAVEVEAERNFRRIFETLCRELRSLKLRHDVIVRRIAPDLISDAPTAARYIHNFRVDQVVWGRALSGKAEGQQINSFEVFWTQRVPPETNVRVAAEDIRTLIRGRKWRITDLDELNDVAIVAEDFVEVCLGAVGIMLFREDRLDDAVEVFARVVRGLRARSPSPLSPHRVAQVRRFQQILDGTRQNLALDAHERHDDARAVELLQQVLITSPTNVDALMTIARAHYYLGDLEKAIEYTRRIESVDSQHPAVSVNLAFFYILSKNYEEVERYYERFRKSDDEAAAIASSVSVFLEEHYECDPAEHAFLYGLAIVSGFFDPGLAKQDLREFLKRTSGESVYEPLRRRARKLLAASP